MISCAGTLHSDKRQMSQVTKTCLLIIKMTTVTVGIRSSIFIRTLDSLTHRAYVLRNAGDYGNRYMVMLDSEYRDSLDYRT